MSQMTIKDLEFIRRIDADLADMVIDICVLNIEDLHKAFNSSENVDNKFIKDLSKDQLSEMLTFYESLLELLVEKEMYEECSKLSEVLNSMKKVYDEVGSH